MLEIILCIVLLPFAVVAALATTIFVVAFGKALAQTFRKKGSSKDTKKS